MTYAAANDSGRFRLAMCLIVALAFGLRVLYAWMASTDLPIRGDINQYVLYAWNLAHRGTFSSAMPDSPDAAPDSYRGPGYPALIAATMVAAEPADVRLTEGPAGSKVLGFSSEEWMQLCIAVQIVLGTLTVWMAMALGRRWLPPSATIVVGLLVAVWPHLVTFSAILLSETLFAFFLLLATWIVCLAEASGKKSTAAAAGTLWGVTYLINPIVVAFPLVAAAFVGLRRGRNLAVVFLAGFAVAPMLWSVRNLVSVAGTGAVTRLEENFVQGSWPQFLPALNSRFTNDISRRIVDAVAAEGALLEESPAAGLEAIGERMADDPLFYAYWYLVQKPYLLWDWNIRVGAGDIYFLPVQHSPFERIPLLSACRDVLRRLNPMLFALAFVACIGILLGPAADRRRPFVPTLLVLLTIYLTVVHLVLQAEPRYSIPYRPLEVLLAMTAAAWIVDWLRQRFTRTPKARSTANISPGVPDRPPHLQD
jgi:hypothetical protein